MAAMAIQAAAAVHKGCDTSHYQISVDFGTMKNEGNIEFVGLKVSEGIGNRDQTFGDRRNRAHEVGFQWYLLYHFFHPTDDIAGQVQNYAGAVVFLQPGEKIAIDIESTPGWDQLSPLESFNRVTAWVSQCKSVFGISANSFVLYGSYGWLQGQFGEYLDQLAFMIFWDARYNSVIGPTGALKPQIWQNGEYGTVPGVSGGANTDTDLWVDDETWARPA
jgi:GH25 family lysozyme M1 (1,4-beta-N-acetylmuramidase)